MGPPAISFQDTTDTSRNGHNGMSCLASDTSTELTFNSLHRRACGMIIGIGLQPAVSGNAIAFTKWPPNWVSR